MGQPNPADPGATPPANPTEPPKTEPPATGDDIGRMREALAKANEEAKTFRLELKALKERDPMKELLEKLGQKPEPGQDATTALQSRIAAMEERAAKAELARDRAEVAAAKGLSAAQAKRLQGATREELEADADELLAAFPAAPAGDGTPRTPAPDPSQGARGGGADREALIKEAQAKGDWRAVIRLQNEKLADAKPA